MMLLKIIKFRNKVLSIAEAEWMSGWIALTFLNKPNEH